MHPVRAWYLFLISLAIGLIALMYLALLLLLFRV